MKQYSKAVERMQRGICHPEHVKAAAELKTLLDMVKQQIPNATWAKKEVIDAFERSGIDIPTFLVPFEVAPHLDEEAISCCLAMLERNLPPSDIILMAFTSAAELLPDTLAQEEAVLDLLIQRYTGNPAINQEELMKLDWSRKVGESIANSVILPRDQVEALAIEATRQQIIELQSIVSGEEVPVSPRDNDVIHIKTMTEKLMPLIAKIPPGSLPQELADPIMKAVQHFVQHVDQAEKKGADKKFIAEMKAQVKAAMDHLTKGKAPPVNPNVMPAAAAGAMPMPRGRRPSINQTEVAQQAADAIDPSFMGVIDQAASPPNPPTAA
jgi:hypothetical protein